MAKKATPKPIALKNATKNVGVKAPNMPKSRVYLSQADIPSITLDKALAVAQAIVENYASKPATPLQVAMALGVSPTTGGFRTICGAALAYGLTKGGAAADTITVEPLALRILKPTLEGDETVARIEAFLRPRVLSDFFNKYDGQAIPRQDITENVLETMGVPADKASQVYSLIMEQGEALKIIVDLNGKKYVTLPKDSEGGEIQPIIVSSSDTKSHTPFDSNNASATDNDEPILRTRASSIDTETVTSKIEADKERLKKVFITHGKNTKFIEPIKKLLSFGELQSVVSVEKTSVSQPVPDKVMNEMRECGAAIIHVEDETKLIDATAKEVVVINPNVLIEIGAAMALFGRRFILLVKDGVTLPSNLQGLFEVRYQGDGLDGDATIKLIEAINDIKNQQLPNQS